MTEELIAEDGSSGNIRFINPEAVRMYDSGGNVMLCKCGKPAGSAVIGTEAFIVWCSDCDPLNKETVKFVYKQFIDGK